MPRLKSLSLVSVALFLLAACATRPEVIPTPAEYALEGTSSGILAEAEARLEPPLNEDESALHLLTAGNEALQWRLALVDMAQREINLQYFIWHDDASGSLLMEHIFHAADRGVKVRMLIDDFHLVSHAGLSGDDRNFAALAYHPNIDLRLFNPGKYRGGTLGIVGSMASDSKRFNRRMHNKTLEVDGHFAVVGGRNIGDEYFGLASEFNFVDFDAVVTGSAVAQVRAAFDLYWNSDLPFPASQLASVDEADYLDLRKDNTEYVAEQQEKLANFTNLNPLDFLDTFYRKSVRGQAEFYVDTPSAERNEAERLYEKIQSVVSVPEEEMLQVTPYMIPARDFLKHTEEEAQAGIESRLLTNSLATNNQPSVHAHYEQYRARLMDRGVQLYELHHQPGTELRGLTDTDPVSADFIALHMKAAVIDRRECLIGTMNSDPRSLDINTEDVMHIHSETFCGALANHVDLLMAGENAWKVARDEKGKPSWTSYEGTVEKQPVRKSSQRFRDWLYRIFPEKQL